MAIAFGRKATPIDGNIERVVARLAAITEPVPGAKPAIAAAARALTPDLRAGDFAQALMDLGAGVCTPRAPGCLACPIAAHCRGRRAAIAASLPRKAAKVARPVRRAIAFVVLRSDGAVLLRRRPETGLLGGMLEVPSSVWHSSEDDFAPALNAAPVAADWTELDQPVVHVFTHFRLELRVLRAEVAKRTPLRAEAEPSRCRWWPRATLADAALPSVMRKVLAAALA
jgi:A/G-specific adenine glycosylase